MNDDYLLRKIEDSHQAIAKTVSDFGAIVNNNNNEIVDLKRLVKDHVEKVDKILDSHDTSIKNLDEARTTIFTSVKTLWIVIPVIVVLGGYIVNQWTGRLSKIEADDRETYKTFIKLLEDKKNYLNQSELKDIIANIYR